MRYEVDHRGDNVTVYAHPSAIFSFHRSRLKGSFPLWSVFSYLELWAFLSGSAICLTDLTLMSDGLSTSPKGAYSSVSCNNPLRSLTFPNRHWSQSKVVVSSHTSICENRLRFCCECEYVCVCVCVFISPASAACVTAGDVWVGFLPECLFVCISLLDIWVIFIMDFFFSYACFSIQ